MVATNHVSDRVRRPLLSQRVARPRTTTSITNDGRRLDTAEAVIEFFEEQRREAGGSGPGLYALADHPPLDVDRPLDALERHGVREFLVAGGSPPGVSSAATDSASARSASSMRPV